MPGFPVFSLFTESFQHLKKLKKIEKSKKVENSEKTILNNAKEKNSNIDINNNNRDNNDNSSSNNNNNNNNNNNSNNSNNSNNNNNISINSDELYFPCVYGQKEAKQAITESLFWPKIYHKLFASLCPEGSYAHLYVRAFIRTCIFSDAFVIRLISFINNYYLFDFNLSIHRLLTKMKRTLLLVAMTVMMMMIITKK